MTVAFERCESQAVEACVEYSKASPIGRREKRRFLLRLSFGASVLLTAVGGVLFSLLGDGVLSVPIPVLFVFAWPVYYCVFTLSYPRIAARVIHKALQGRGKSARFGHTTIQVTAEGIRTTTSSTETLRRWDNLQELTETPGFLVLTVPEGLLDIPRAAFESTEACSQFLRLLHARGVAGSENGTDGSAWYRSKDLTDAPQTIRRGE